MESKCCERGKGELKSQEKRENKHKKSNGYELVQKYNR